MLFRSLDGVGPATWLAPLVLTLLSLIGFGASLTVPAVPAARSEGGIASTLEGAIRTVRSNRTLLLAILGSAFFWTIASLVGQDVLVYAKTILALSDSLSGLPLALLSIGIGAGAVLAGKLSGDRVELGLIPFGAFGICFFLLLLGLLGPGLAGTLILMTGLGLSCGLFVVPVNSLIQ